MALNQKYDQSIWRGFVAHAKENPTDMSVTGVAADWLEEERFDPARVEYMRLCLQQAALCPNPLTFHTSGAMPLKSSSESEVLTVRLNSTAILRLLHEKPSYLRIISTQGNTTQPREILSADGRLNYSAKFLSPDVHAIDSNTYYVKPLSDKEDTYNALRKLAPGGDQYFPTNFRIVSVAEADPDYIEREYIKLQLMQIKHRMIETQVEENRILARGVRDHAWLDLPVPIYGQNGFMQGIMADWDWWKENYEEMTATEPISATILPQGCPDVTYSLTQQDSFAEIHIKGTRFTGATTSTCLSKALDRKIDYLEPNARKMEQLAGPSIQGYDRNLMTAEFVAYPFSAISSSFFRKLHRAANRYTFRDKLEAYYRILHITPELQNGPVVLCSVLLLNGDLNASASKDIDFSEYLPETTAWGGASLSRHPR